LIETWVVRGRLAGTNFSNAISSPVCCCDSTVTRENGEVKSNAKLVSKTSPELFMNARRPAADHVNNWK